MLIKNNVERISIFPNKSLQKYTEMILKQIESIEKKSFPKNEIMSIKEEVSKKTNTLLIVYHETDEIKERKRIGLGEKLLKSALEKMNVPKRSKADLHVDIEREAAINLYKKIGFKAIKRVVNYYEFGRDAWLMEFREDE
ncbi:15411_t:CDS:2 [Funneliformis geosporum]|uniref:15411_t:CDS:1 n=1 Tax=Funneliformis geosporum TaxID=1117311 RepID=A0A9W4SBQ2_9GLOM|nr:15411_t:CDS:2 [Funneliformis geosporum]